MPRMRRRRLGRLLLAACVPVLVAGCERRAVQAAVAVSVWPATPAPSAPASPPPRHYAKDYAFTADWFTPNIPIWQQVLAPFKGKPGISYLEIGLWEGRSALWMLENVLTHPTARLVGIDVFTGEVKQRYLANLKLSGSASKATTIVGPSQQELRKLPLGSFDVVYVDGSHAADDVLSDAVQSFELLKPGGLLIFDDYDWGTSSFPIELLPRAAIDVFVLAHRHSLEVVGHGYQMIVRKVANPCAAQKVPELGRYLCSPVGPHFYDWNRRALFRADGSQVPLTPQERTLLEEQQRGWSVMFRDLTPTVAQRPEVKALLDRLAVAPAGRR